MKQTFTLILLVTLLINAIGQVPQKNTDVMFQAFGWDSYTDSKWTNLENQADELSTYFDLIWLPPSGNVLSTFSMGYFPVYYFNQNSAFGTEKELKKLISTLKANGTKIVADVVINHRNGRSNWIDFPTEEYKGETYSWGLEAICENDEVRYADLPYDHIPQGAPDTGDNFDGARDVDHTNENVQNTIKAHLDFLKNEIGYDGWRYDFVKGFTPYYIGFYNNSADNYFSVGEYWDSSFDNITYWIDETGRTSTAFDFPQKYALNEAFNNGYNLTNLVWKRNNTLDQPAGLVHSDIYRKYSVTFIDNHDSGRSDDGHNHSRFTGNVLAAYAFILSNPGVPCVWQNHWNNNDYKEKIKELIEARKDVELHSESDVEVITTQNNLYVAKSTGFNGSLIVKIGNGNYNAPEDYTLKTFGDDYAVWTKVESNYKNIKEITIRFYNESDRWSNINIHAWDIQKNLTTWPGEAMTKLDNNWYSYTFKNIRGNLNIVINSGDEQTLDINNIVANSCFSLSNNKDINGKYYYKSVNCGDGSQSDPIKVQFKNDISWDKTYLYSWDIEGEPITGSWPGTELTKLENDWYSFEFDSSIEFINIIFSNGSGTQTADILGVTQSSCYIFTSPDALPSIADCSTVDKITNEEEENFIIYPNPTSGTLNIEGVDINYNKVVITDITGKEIKIKYLNSTNATLNIEELENGIYLIYLKGKNLKSDIYKIIKK